jgi:drug/metabolite transporter (DMT)-like permease
MMPVTTMALILGAVVCSAAGQLLLKSGARHLAGEAGGGFLLAALQDPRVLAGLVAWTASTICWLHVLRAAPLSKAYGLTSLTYVLVLVGSGYFFGEEVRRAHAAGTILIVIGIACLVYGD